MNWIHNDINYLCGQYKNTNDIMIDKMDIDTHKIKFACFDLDDTLITTKSGKKFANTYDDWKFMYDNVSHKLLEMHNENYDIVIISNQAGISKQNNGISEWKHKVTDICVKLNIPVMLFAALKKNLYRKPFPTFWNMLTNGKMIDMKDSFYCGDACGRENDFSDTDVKFAVNCGISFKVPELIFIGVASPIPSIKYSVDFQKVLKKNTPKFIPTDREMIIMVGSPGSGKSTYVKNNIVPHNYVVINRDTLKTIPKCLKECQKYMDLSKSLVIDNTNPDKESREKFITLAIKNKYKCRCIIIDTDMCIAKHNANFRHYISDGKIDMIPDVVFNKYKKKYIYPKNEEGFSEIIVIPFSVDAHIDLVKYNMYFL